MKIPPDILKAVLAREMTGRKAAQLMSISEQYFCKLLKKTAQTRTPGHTSTERKAAHDITISRTEFRKLLAEKVRKRQLTLAKAALQANCTERTMYRYVNNEHLR